MDKSFRSAEERERSTIAMLWGIAGLAWIGVFLVYMRLFHNG